MPSPRTRRLTVLAASAALVAPLAAAAPALAAPAAKGPLLSTQLLSVNDFHGNLEPPTGSSGLALDDQGVSTPVGGAAYLATHVKALRAQARSHGMSTTTVAAGDLIGASPLTSALFHDEPTIEFFTQLGVFASATGNHEYDEGIAELQRLQKGGCHPVDGCQGDTPFTGAGFTYLSANVTDDKGRLVMPAKAIKRISKDVRIGFIGLPLEDTPSIVTASGVAGLHFGDEVTAVNRAAATLQRQGVQSIVVMLHQGDNTVSGALPNSCGVAKNADGTDGPATTIAKQVSPAVDVVFTGHSHQAYNCTVLDPAGHPRPVVQGGSFGRFVSEVDLKIDPRTRDVRRDLTTATNHLVTRDVTPDADAQALVSRFVEKAAPKANAGVATITADIPRTASPAGETPLGDVIADAQLASTDGADEGGAVVALMNPGGVRADLVYASSPAGEGDGVVTYGEAFTVQPFTNYLTTLTLTGAQLDGVLEQQFDNTTGTKVLQPSSSLHYTWSSSAPLGSKVSGITVAGVPVDPAASYRVTVNNFLAGGGDGFTRLTEGTDPLVGAIDLDSFVAYGKTASPIAPPALTRITQVP